MKVFIKKSRFGNNTIDNFNFHIDITIIVKSGLLIKSVSETIRNKPKEQRAEFLCTLLNTLDTTVFGKVFTHKGVIRAGKEKISAGQEF